MTKLHLLPQCQGDDQFIPGHLIFHDALDHQLEPAGGLPSRINWFKRCLLLTNIHLVTWSPAGASPGGFHPPSDWFSTAALLPPNYTMDWHMWGLEVILPHIFIIEGGLGHFPPGVAGPGMGQNVDSQGQLGHGVPQWQLNGMEGGEPQKHPFLSPWTGVWEWH